MILRGEFIVKRTLQSIKRVMRIAAFGVVLLSGSNAGAVTGDELHALCIGGKDLGVALGFCHGFIIGAAETLAFTQPTNSDDPTTYCLPPGATNEQIINVVKDNLRDYPNVLDMPAWGIVAAALAGAFPCH